ncbi:hypothetical protein ACFXO9_24960 [Nocardia tengchongensis]|uniref:hypothetical protein n=1 Tax=Nocardia tengchongensis TaxID=2055889 RepID=UPI003679A1CC
MDVADFPAAEIDTGRGTSEEDLPAELRPVLEQAVTAHPRIGELIMARGEAETHVARDAQFRYGLDRILDGLGQRLRAVGLSG